MTWWTRLPFHLRTTLLAAVLSLLTGVSHLTADECEVIATDGQPRDCTLSERIGKCGWEVWDSWKSCVDPDGNEQIEVGFLKEQYCGFMAAIDFAGCAVEIPLDLMLE